MRNHSRAVALQRRRRTTAIARSSVLSSASSSEALRDRRVELAVAVDPHAALARAHHLGDLAGGDGLLGDRARKVADDLLVGLLEQVDGDQVAEARVLDASTCSRGQRPRAWRASPGVLAAPVVAQAGEVELDVLQAARAVGLEAVDRLAEDPQDEVVDARRRRLVAVDARRRRASRSRRGRSRRGRRTWRAGPWRSRPAASRVISSRLCSLLTEHDCATSWRAARAASSSGVSSALRLWTRLLALKNFSCAWTTSSMPSAVRPRSCEHEGGAVGGEDPVGQLQVEQPVADAGGHLTGAVDEELVVGLVVQQPVLDRRTRRWRRGRSSTPGRSRLSRSAAYWPSGSCQNTTRWSSNRRSRCGRTVATSAHSLASKPGIFFRAAPNFG